MGSDSGQSQCAPEYFDTTFGMLVDSFLLQKLDVDDPADNNDDDFVRNYALSFIFLAVLIMQMKDTAAEGDGNRNLINQKLLLSVCLQVTGCVQ